MRVYLASSFELKDEVQRISDLLESREIGITRKWWLINYKEALGDMPDKVWYRHEKVQWVSKENFKAIDEADAVILICPNDLPHKFTGANIEVGYAVAKKKRVFSVGQMDRSAMYVPIEKYESINALLPALENLCSKHRG